MRTLVISLCFIASSSVYASEGLSQLTQALSRLQSSSPVHAELNYSFKEWRGKGKSQRNFSGQALLRVEQNQQGLSVNYQPKVLANIAQEAQARVKDETVNTPTLSAVDRLNTVEINNMLSAAASLARRMEQATFIDETEVKFHDKTKRSVNFSLPLEALIRDKKTRGYVSKFSGHFSVIIDDDGTPLQSKLKFSGKGSAYIIFSVKAYGEAVSDYQVTNNRLVLAKQHYVNGYESTFNDGEVTEQQQLTLLPNQPVN